MIESDVLHNSTPEHFEAGNYAAVAMTGGRDEWQTYAALGLIGKTQEALEGLSRFDHPSAHFYSAVASWIDGDEDTAARTLEKIYLPHAQALLNLIRKPQIQVLSQLRWSQEISSNLLTAAAADSKFKLKNIGFHPENLPNEPYADIHQFYDPHQPPDFYICQMVEWHLIPPNLQQLPCPIFGQTADYDLHIQTVYPWLQLFDELLVTDPSEWQDVSQLVQVPVSTFPKSFGIPESLPPIPMGTREFDLFVSGTVTHPYHPDKAQLLHQILRAAQTKLKIINGFEAVDEYYNNLSNAKVCYTYIRHPQALPTRGLEALSMGCGLVVQKDSVLTLFVGEQQGVLTYELEANNLGSSIRRIVEQWSEFEQRARLGAEIIRREFTASRVASQYLRFLTFLAAKPRDQRQKQPVEQLFQKRYILQKGWLPSNDLCHSPILKQIGTHNYEHLKARLDTEPVTSHLFIDLARESVLYNYHRALHQVIPVQEWLSSLMRIYRTGVSRFPQSLVLRFNFIRSVLHFGQPQAVSEILELLEETLSLPVSYWQIDVMEDVFPWDFCANFFNYRRYFDLVTEHLMHGRAVESALCQLILASLHYYKGFYSNYYQGFYSQSLDEFKQATTLDPEFADYQFHYAKQLLERSLVEDYSEAGALLTKLVEKSILFLEALELLEQLQPKLLFASPPLEELTATFNQAKPQIKFVENYPEVPLQPALTPSQSEFVRSHSHFPQNLTPERTDLEKLQARIQAMESSKFWKLRQAWFKIKRAIGLPTEED